MEITAKRRYTEARQFFLGGFSTNPQTTAPNIDIQKHTQYLSF